MEFQFIKSNRGFNLVLDKHFFQKKRTRGNLHYYKCINTNCDSRLTIESTTKTIVNQPGLYHHFRTEDKNVGGELKSDVLKCIETKPTTTSIEIYKGEIQKHNAESFTVPRHNHFRRTVFRERARCLHAVLKNLILIFTTDQSL